MYYVEFNIDDDRVKYLMGTDSRVESLIRYIGTSELELETNGFSCLVKYIIGQQISDKARETIWRRMSALVNSITPDIILSLDDQNLRDIGLSYRKITYIKILAECTINSNVDFEVLPSLSNEEIIRKLTTIKGIGQWTAEMYLIFSLGRENVLSKSDGTIKRAIQWMYDMKELPSAKDLEICCMPWRKYATIVSSYLWKSTALGLLQRPFDEVIKG